MIPIASGVRIWLATGHTDDTGDLATVTDDTAIQSPVTPMTRGI